jgi:hypothetical protein
LDDKADDSSDEEEEDDSSKNMNEGIRGENQNGNESMSSSTMLRQSNRIKSGVKKPDHYTLVMKKLKDKMVDCHELKESLTKAQEDEVRLVFEELPAMEPVRKEDTTRVLSSQYPFIYR